jgi:hypothetical protein
MEPRTTITGARRVALLLVAACCLAAAANAATHTKFPVGVFRATIADADLRAAHATNDIPENHGRFTLTIRANGRWRLVQKAPNPLLDPVFAGTYTVKGSIIDFRTVAPAEFAGDDVVGWRFDGKYLHLHLKSKSPYPETAVLYDAHPWRRIG